MSVFSFISQIVKPVGDIIDNLTTTDEEKMKLKIELTKIENELAGKIIELEGKVVESQAEVLKAEAQGNSWLQRNWRPITML
ncbi:MAG: holin family protein, partial [bacterium]|nr:holin family protein [bacterium]